MDLQQLLFKFMDRLPHSKVTISKIDESDGLKWCVSINSGPFGCRAVSKSLDDAIKNSLKFVCFAPVEVDCDCSDFDDFGNPSCVFHTWEES